MATKKAVKKVAKKSSNKTVTIQGIKIQMGKKNFFDCFGSSKKEVKVMGERMIDIATNGDIDSFTGMLEKYLNDPKAKKMKTPNDYFILGIAFAKVQQTVSNPIQAMLSSIL